MQTKQNKPREYVSGCFGFIASSLGNVNFLAMKAKT